MDTPDLTHSLVTLLLKGQLLVQVSQSLLPLSHSSPQLCFVFKFINLSINMDQTPCPDVEKHFHSMMLPLYRAS